MHEPDPLTIRSAAAGDLGAFTELVHEAQPHVWRFLRHLVRDEETAADLTQETFVRVYRSLGSFRQQSRFTTWLFRIARNVAIDEQRRAQRRSSMLAESEPDISTRGFEAGAASGAEIKEALRSLPATQREAFVLVEVFGLRYREAAEVVGVAEGTVKSRVFHARSALVAWLTVDDEVENEHG